MDESENIDYTKLQKMTEWIYRTGWMLAMKSRDQSFYQNSKIKRFILFFNEL